MNKSCEKEIDSILSFFNLDMEKEVEDLLVHLDWIKKDLKLDIPEGKTEIEVEKGFVLIQNKLFGEIQEIKTVCTRFYCPFLSHLRFVMN